MDKLCSHVLFAGVWEYIWENDCDMMRSLYLIVYLLLFLIDLPSQKISPILHYCLLQDFNREPYPPLPSGCSLVCVLVPFCQQITPSAHPPWVMDILGQRCLTQRGFIVTIISYLQPSLPLLNTKGRLCTMRLVEISFIIFNVLLFWTTRYTYSHWYPVKLLKLFKLIVSMVAVDALAPNGARPSAGIELMKFGSLMCITSSSWIKVQNQ